MADNIRYQSLIRESTNKINEYQNRRERRRSLFGVGTFLATVIAVGIILYRTESIYDEEA